MGVQKGEVSVAAKPVGVQKSEMSVAVKPVGVQKSEMSVAVKPVGLQKGEVSVAVKPMKLQIFIQYVFDWLRLVASDCTVWAACDDGADNGHAGGAGLDVACGAGDGRLNRGWVRVKPPLVNVTAGEWGDPTSS